MQDGPIIRALRNWPERLCLTPMLKRWALLPKAALALMLALAAYWALLDGVRPIVVLRQDIVPKAAPGGTVEIVAEVRRDQDVRCSLDLQRYIVSATGARHFEGVEQHITAQALAAMTSGSPNTLTTSIRVPADISAGRARLIVSLSYRCNPVQAIFPIESSVELLFDVVPSAQRLGQVGGTV